jgi:hypothetical protein
MRKPAWWGVATCFGVAHFIALAGYIFYCLDQYYDAPCPLESTAFVLVLPAYFFFPLVGEAAVCLLPFNSFLWGCVLAEPVRWWLGWPPWRFSLRTLLIITTLVALLLGASAALKPHSETVIPPAPVVQPSAD